jgi:osmotically-inducible protein OsmY
LFPVLAIALLLTAAPGQASLKTDGRIESSARNSYVFQTYLKGDDIKIQSKDGVVTLSGSVHEESHKSLARDTVAELPGVKKVENQLEVNGEGSAENSDIWLAMKVKTTLLFHRNVNAVTTEVSVKDAVVTLRGDAASEAQKELTTEYAKDVTGVKDVMNEMTVSGNAGNAAEKDLVTKLAGDVHGVKSVKNRMTVPKS